MPFVCIFVPDFAVEALLRAEPELRSQALAVLEGKAPLEKVFAVNENARRLGVTPGMTKPQVETCTELTLRARSVSEEVAAHAALLECAQTFSPRVEDAGYDTLLLDLAGMESLFGSLSEIARSLARRVADLGLQASVTVAGNPDAATIAARGFSGVTVIPDGREAEQLGRLPIEVLFSNVDDREAAQLLETLVRWGIRNLDALAALPDVALSERLGQAGVHLQELARGATARTLVPVEESLIFEEIAELEYPLLLLEPLAFLLSGMLDRICSRLNEHALATQELRLEMELASEYQCDDTAELALGTNPSTSLRAGSLGRPFPHSLFQRTLRLPVPLLDPKTFLKLLQLDLKAHPPGAPIVKVRLAAEPARPRAAQNGIFQPPSPEPEKLELTLARIASIVGENQVGSLEILDTHRPEGFRMQRFTPHSIVIPSRWKRRMRNESAPRNPQSCSASEKLQIPRGARDDNSLDSEERSDLVTALRIFRPPLIVAVTMRDGGPVHIAGKRRKEIQGEILWAAGPWRSSGDWWEQEGWSRDEWDIAVQEQTGIVLYRLVHDLFSGRWLLEGQYD